MRLTHFEQQAFIDTLAPYIHETAELRLFGSRVNDAARGGDIDLIILVTQQDTAENLMYYKARILSEIKTIIGEQKIDLLIDTFNTTDVFIKNMLPQSMSIHRFQ